MESKEANLRSDPVSLQGLGNGQRTGPANSPDTLLHQPASGYRPDEGEWKKYIFKFFCNVFSLSLDWR